jgi:hypothetical protein
MRKGLAIAVLGCATALAAAPASQAVTVGPPTSYLNTLAANVQGDPGCRVIMDYQGNTPPSCTFLGNDISGAWTSQISRGEWRVRIGRVRTGPRVGPMVFTVIRLTRSQAGAGGVICCFVPFESQVFVPPRPNAVNEIPINLPMKNTVDVISGEPIETVDYLGISLLTQGSSVPAHVPPGGTSAQTSFIAPAIRQGQERTQDGTFGGNILLVNGEAEPASAGQVAAANLSALDASRATFRAAGRGPSLLARAKVGTRVTYSLSRPAPVMFKVQRRKGGRKVGRKCKKPTRRNRRRKRCNLTLKGSFVDSGTAGANSIGFTGRLRGHKLRPGRYVLVARPAGGAARSLRFRIVR